MTIEAFAGKSGSPALTRRQLLGLAAALGASACTPRFLRGGDAADSFNWQLATPESVGLAPTVVADLRAVMQKFIDSQRITGAVAAVARNNRLFYFEAQGLRNTETGTPLQKDDLFRMASSTKVVVAVAILILMEEGKLSIDDKVSRFIPGFEDLQVAETPATGEAPAAKNFVPMQREVTIKDLLTHTSGLGSSGFPDSRPINGQSKKIIFTPDDTLASFIPRLALASLDFQPGSRFSYSPVMGFDVLAYIVEVVSGQPADVFMRERIFEPLEMRSTWFHVPASAQSRIVPLYTREDDRWQTSPGMLDGLSPRYVSGAGGLYSTAHDFLHFYLMLLNKGSLNGRRVLKPETVTLMTQNHVGTLFAESVTAFTATAGMGFGLGAKVVIDGQKVKYCGVGSFGWLGAYGTDPWADPALGFAGVILVQQRSPELTPEFQAALRQSIVA
jgi:CubicO group peptidase (beta-lactamase class C family)